MLERLKATKIDPKTIKLARVFIPAFEDPFDGILPEEEVELVVAQGKGKFAESTMVQVGHMDSKTKAPIGFVYRQIATYQGFRKGRDICISPADLKNGKVIFIPEERGLWMRLEDFGRILE